MRCVCNASADNATLAWIKCVRFTDVSASFRDYLCTSFLVERACCCECDGGISADALSACVVCSTLARCLFHCIGCCCADLEFIFTVYFRRFVVCRCVALKAFCIRRWTRQWMDEWIAKYTLEWAQLHAHTDIPTVYKQHACGCGAILSTQSCRWTPNAT